MAEMNLFLRARHEVPSITLKQLLHGCFMLHTSQSELASVAS